MRTRYLHWEPLPFQVDSGTNVTSIPIIAAQQARLPTSKRVVELEVRTAVGSRRQRVHPGHMTGQIPGLDGREVVWPCHFAEHDAPTPPILLCLTGVVNDLDIGLTGDYFLEARYGWLVLKERLGQRRMVRTSMANQFPRVRWRAWRKASSRPPVSVA